jgi:hypothetical protein
LTKSGSNLRLTSDGGAIPINDTMVRLPSVGVFIPPTALPVATTDGPWAQNVFVFANAQTITNRALASNVATLTTSSPHGLIVGSGVIIEDVATGYNGHFTVTAVGSTTTFSYACVLADESSTASSGTMAGITLSIPSIGITYRARATNVATITTATDHGLSVGQKVQILSGGAVTYDGLQTVASTPTPTTFTYANTAANESSTATTGWIGIPWVLSAGGVRVKNGNPAHTYVGKVRAVTGPAFADDSATRYVVSNFGQVDVVAMNFLTANSSLPGTTTFTEVGSFRPRFICDEQMVQISSIAFGANTVVNNALYNHVRLSGVECEGSMMQSYPSPINGWGLNMGHVKSALAADGFNYAALFARGDTASGTLAHTGISTSFVRCSIHVTFRG